MSLSVPKIWVNVYYISQNTLEAEMLIQSWISTCLFGAVIMSACGFSGNHTGVMIPSGYKLV